jgi:hypothetical protein
MADEPIDLYINEDGTIQGVYADDWADLFEPEDGFRDTRRASHVEPSSPTLARFLPNRQGWVADMSPVGGPLLADEHGYPFQTRAEALAAERRWLAARMTEGRLET